MQKAQLQQDNGTGMPKVIAVSSGKGGVGKSSISVNLAISLAKTGSRVCLLDADTGLANTNILLGLVPEFSIEHVLYGAKPIEEVMLDGPHGLKIIPGANGISECVTLHARQQLRLTRELTRIESDFDFLIIDTAAGIADTTLDFISAAQHTLVVITPEPTSLTDSFSLIKLLNRRGKHRFHVVVNMSSSAGQAKEVYHRFAAAVDKYIGVDTNYLGHVLRDESMRAAVVLQNPVAMFPDDDPSSRSFITLADSLEQAIKSTPVTSSFSAYWHQQFRDQRDGKNTEPLLMAEEGVSEPQLAEARDRDYLSELRSRMLLLIEQGHADEADIKALLNETLLAYKRRYQQSPVELLGLVDELLTSPNRDDQLMRDIADRVKPWAAFPVSGPSEVLSVKDLLDSSAPLSAGVKEPPVTNILDQDPSPLELPEDDGDDIAANTFEIIDELPTSDANIESAFTAAKTSTASTNDEVRIRPTHQYDSQRFGSQKNLLDILQRQAGKKQLLVDLLDSFIQ
ncbi:MAG: MinD-like ATPase involved in chromosome partitioning or flagellar assembly [Oceanicoccus sp.]